MDARLLNIEMVSHPEIHILISDANGTMQNSPEMAKSVVAAAESAGVPHKVPAASRGVGERADGPQTAQGGEALPMAVRPAALPAADFCYQRVLLRGPVISAQQV